MLKNLAWLVAVFIVSDPPTCARDNVFDIGANLYLDKDKNRNDSPEIRSTKVVEKILYLCLTYRSSMYV